MRFKTNAEQKDYKKFYVSGGEPGFNAKRNKQVIEDSIKKADELKEKRKREYDELIGERVDAAATYLTSKKGAESGKSIEKYFGRQTLSYLRGEGIVKELQLRESNLFNTLMKGGDR
jgi:hypothetical protein